MFSLIMASYFLFPHGGNSLSLTMGLTGWGLEINSVTLGLHGTEPSSSLMSPSSGL